MAELRREEERKQRGYILGTQYTVHNALIRKVENKKIYKARSVYVKQKGKERKDGTEMIGPRDGEPFIIVP